MAEERLCGYCQKPITDSLYTYKWFRNAKDSDDPEGGQMLPVHNNHLHGTRNMAKGKPYEKGEK